MLPLKFWKNLECNSEERGIAKSFSDFLNRLELKVEWKLIFKDVDNLNDAKERLETIFDCRFDDKLAYFGGAACPTLQIGKANREQLWITSNKVARWYDQPVKLGAPPNLFKGNALLFPELEANVIFWDASEEFLDSYRSQIEDAGLKLVDVKNQLIQP